jgi:hypothetical protein
MANFTNLPLLFPLSLALAAVPAIAATGMEHSGMDWFAPLDHYCERVAVGLWNEPFNAASNLAFLLAAGAILIRQKRMDWDDRPLISLALIAGSVGIGSILFHTFANGWSLVADMLPIAVFIYAFFFFGLRRFLDIGVVTALVATIGLYLASPALAAFLKPVMGPSSTYVPGLVATFGLAIATRLLRGGPVPWHLVAAGGTFAIALFFRELDKPVCDSFPTGTHFLWHIFNGVTIGLALLSAERERLTRRPLRLRERRV